MSVMIVSDETYVKVASTLNHHKEYGRMYILQKILWNVDVNEFVESLRIANYKSYDERYNESSEIPPIKYTRTFPVNVYQLLKSLECIQYQIELDNYMGKEILQKLINAIALYIAHSQPQYDAAEWG